MVRQKQTFYPETVELVLTAPKSLFREPKPVNAQLNQTWLELFNGVMGLEVATDSGMYVCTMRYPVSGSNEKTEWRADLHEKIHKFLKKFERQAERYYIRICGVSLPPPTNLTVNGALQEVDSEVFKRPIGYPPRVLSRVKSHSTTPTSSFSKGQPSYFIATQSARPIPTSTATVSGDDVNVLQMQPEAIGGSKRTLPNEDTFMTAGPSNGRTFQQLKSRKLDDSSSGSKQQKMSSLPIAQIQNIRSIKLEKDVSIAAALENLPVVMEQVEQDSIHGGQLNQANRTGNGNNADYCNDDNTKSSITTVEVEEEAMKSQGIQVQDFKDLTERRFSRFSNAYLLKVKEELRKLQQNHLWDRNVNRSPLACYFLQEILK